MRLIRLLKNDLAREAREWVDEGVISREQAERICSRYGADFTQAVSRSLGYQVLTGLGYLFIGLALITLIGANWDEIPRGLRMGSLIALTMATHGLGLWRYLRGEPGSATGLFLLGNLFFGASIVLIAQIYHLGEHMPDGVFWWALGCLPFAVLLKNPWLALQATVLALVWFWMETNLGFYPMLFPLFILASLWVLWRGRQSVLLLLLTAAGIGLWLQYSLAAWWRGSGHFDFRAENLALGVASLILVYVFGRWLDRRPEPAARDYGAVLSLWSLRIGLVLMLVLSFARPWRGLIGAEWQYLVPMWLLVGLFAAASLLLARRGGNLKSTAGLFAFLLCSLLAATLVENKDHAVYFQLAYNFALIAAGIWLILRGIHGGVSQYFFLGVLAILLTALMRYIDLIGDYIGAALLFALFSAVLLGAARYWRHQRAREGSA